MSTIIDRTTPLGPQCVRCRRRHIKCDSGLPGCARCSREKLPCPGYGARGTTWTIETQQSMSQQRKRLKVPNATLLTPPSSTPTSSRSSTPTAHSGSMTSARPRKSRSTVLVAEIPARLSSTNSENDAYLFTDSWMYYIHQIRPMFRGCLVPDSPQTVELTVWRNTPLLMQHNLVWAVAVHRMARGEGASAHKLLKTRMHTHRGRSMELLRKSVQEMQTSTQAKTLLLLIVVMMAGELGVSSSGIWAAHFEAAWTMLESQGGEDGWKQGLLDAWDVDINTKVACVALIHAEILSSTTCPTHMLVESRRRGLVTMLRDGRIHGLDDLLLVGTGPCPLAIMTALGEANELKASLFERRYKSEYECPGVSTAYSEQLWNIVTQLLCFDPDAQVDRSLRKHRKGTAAARYDANFGQEKMRTSWIKLTACYRSAAVVYVIRSFSSTSIRRALSSECRAFLSSIGGTLEEHQAILSEGLEYLLQDLNTAVKTPTRPNLWRVMFWPLFVHAYDSIAWPGESPKSGTTIQEATKDELLGRLRMLAPILGANALYDAADLLDKVHQRRQYHMTWDWEDAFDSRYIFAV